MSPQGIKTYHVDGEEYHALRSSSGGTWHLIHPASDRTLTVITKEGSQWVAHSHPGKRWKTIEQAALYTITQKNRE